jgi:hypothetical protein
MGRLHSKFIILGDFQGDVPNMNPKAWKQGIDHDFVRAWLLARSAQILEKSRHIGVPATMRMP